MYKFYKVTMIFLLTMLFAAVVSVQALTIGVGGFEPHFIKKDNSGLFIDMIQETFGLLPQYQITFWWDMSIRRMEKELETGRIDVAAPMIKKVDNKGYLSEPVLRFTDVAVTLKNRNLTITKISDLKDKSVIAYEGAKLFLGEEFRKMAESNPAYVEVPEPITPPKMVASGRYDVCILDIYIFLHSIKNWRKNFTSDQFDFHHIFPESYAHIGFKDKKIRDEFNQALKVMKEKGDYEAIYQRYLKKLGYSAN